MVAPNGRSLSSLSPEVAMPPARRFAWSSPSFLWDPAARNNGNARQLARVVHFKRFRLVGMNGASPFPLAAFELGAKTRILGERLLISGDLFRYRYGGYRLTLPGSRGIGGSAALPSLGISSRIKGADFRAGYKLGDKDYAGLSATVMRSHRSALPTLAAANPRITNARSVQIVPSYEHVVPLTHGRSLTLEAAAIHRSSVRVTQNPRLAELGPFVRKIETMRFDAGMTYSANPRLSITGFVRNVTDVRPERSSPLTIRNAVNPKTLSAVLSEPRTLGVALSFRL